MKHDTMLLNHIHVMTDTFSYTPVIAQSTGDPVQMKDLIWELQQDVSGNIL